MGAPIREELVLADSFSQTFRNFDAAANAAINVAETFQQTLNEFSEGFLDGLVSSLNDSRQKLESMADTAGNAAEEQDKITKAVMDTDNEIRKAEGSEDKFAESIRRSESAASSLMGTISKIAGAIGVVKLAENFIQTSDEMSQITAKLNMINDGTRTTAQLQQDIFESAQRSRGAYLDTANLVARLGMNAADAFNSNTEMLQFAENLNKSFKIAGASAQEQASVILQMSQALGSGVLRGQEFNAVMSGAPIIMQNIAEYLGVGVGQLRDMAAEGQISADVVKNALLSATLKINEQFNSIPLTFSDVMTSAKNKLVDGMSKAFDEWSKKLNSKDIQASIDNITDALVNLAQIAGDALLVVADVTNDIARNWDAIEPIIIGVGATVVSFKVLNVIQAAEVGAAWTAAFGGLPLLIGGAVGLVTTLSNAFDDFETDATSHVGEVERSIQRLDGTFEAFGNASVGYVAQIGDALDSVSDKAQETTKFVQGITREMTAISDNIPIFGDLIHNIQNRVAEATFGKTHDEILNEYHLKEYAEKYNLTFDESDTFVDKFNKISDAINKELQLERQAKAGAWYNEYYGRDTGYHINEEDWAKPWYGYQHELFEMMVAEHNANRVEDEERKRALEEIKDHGVKVRNEVKLSDEDLQIFRDIAENRYIANVSLETLAPSVSVNVENNGQNLSEDDIASAVTKALETQISEHTAISHG